MRTSKSLISDRQFKYLVDKVGGHILNLPNKLTLLRVIMIPFFIVMLLMNDGETTTFRYVAAGIFIAASVTDWLDGAIARKYNLVTNFGKFMDPLADKLLVCSALICLVALEQFPVWMVIVIVSREFIISGFRLVAAEQGLVIAASYWGKFKTVTQMAAIILMILNISALYMVTTIVMWTALILTVVSLIDYIVKNHAVLTAGAI